MESSLPFAEWSGQAQSRRVNYERDPIKHYVRMCGWLPVCRQRARKVKGRPFRYFTFCAESAVDVFMLEAARILKRNNDGKLIGTYFCEQDPLAFSRITDLIKAPEQGFPGRFEDIILFQDTKETQDKTYTDFWEDDTNARVLELLQLKEQHQRLADAFPFDVVNLDATGPLLPPRQQDVSRLLKAIFQILDWQTTKAFTRAKHHADKRVDGQRIEQFTLLLTTQVDGSAENHLAIQNLADLIQENINNTAGFRQHWEAKFSQTSPAELAERDFVQFFTMAISKRLIEHGFALGWDVANEGRFLYNRQRGSATYTMLCEVLTFTRLEPPRTRLFDKGIGIPSQHNRNRAVERVLHAVWRESIWADHEVSVTETRERVYRHLNGVLEFRDHWLARATNSR